MANGPCINERRLADLFEPTRNRYFYGKLLDEFHLELEQSYFNRKRWLLNRLTLGSGIVFGLQVTVEKDRQQLQIAPGVAIDGYGREIILPEPTQIDPRNLTDACGQATGKRIEDAASVEVRLAYLECDAEPVPVLVSECETQRTCAPSLVRERCAVSVQQFGFPIVPPAGPHISPGMIRPFPGSVGPAITTPSVERAEAMSVGGGSDAAVLLASVNLPEAGQKITEGDINQKHRPVVSTDLWLYERLRPLFEQGRLTESSRTRVKELSWIHDGELSIGKFMQDGLIVTFSDEISSTPKNGRGWFEVTVEYPVASAAGSLAMGAFFPVPFVFPKGEEPDLLAGTVLRQGVLEEQPKVHGGKTEEGGINVNGNAVVFRPDPGFAKSFIKALDTTRNQMGLCRVIVRCSYLRDKNDGIVDGNCFGLRKQSSADNDLDFGNGVAGGDLDSWFVLTR